MARITDPDLEQHILRKSLALLDRRGPEALSMRSVAKAAGTTTPTLYDRFKNHENLLAAITRFLNQELLFRVAAEKSIEEMALAYIGYAAEYPSRYEFLYKQRAKVWETDAPKPIFEALKNQLAIQLKIPDAVLDETGLAVMALVHGSALFKIAMGANAAGGDVDKATRFALKRIVADGRKSKGRH